MSKSRVLVAAIVVVLAGGAVAFAFVRQKQQQQAQGALPSSEAHGEAEGVDFRLSPVLAGYNAPEGKTHCETAYNALKATEQAASASGRPMPWPPFPERDAFLARCERLPANAQQCLVPKYASKHHAECDPLNEKYPVVDALLLPTDAGAK